MQIEIYADSLFLINFIMVYFIFWTVNKFIKNKVKIKSLLLGAFLASLFYLIIVIFIPFKKYLSFFIISATILFSIFIAFKPKSLKDFLKIFLLVNLVSFAFGGACIAIFYYTNFANILGGMVNFTLKNLSLKLLLICIGLSYIIIKLSLNWYKRIFFKGQSFYEIILYKNKENIKLNALLDTGNCLKEPISKKPVLITEFFAIENILTEPLKKIFKNNEENDLEKLLALGYENNIRFIPFKSIGEKNGLMIGIKIDKLEIKSEKPILIKDAIIGISNIKISENGLYNALLNPEMLK